MKLTKYGILLTSSLLLGGLAQSCATDDPFDNGGEGELRMKMVINSDVTRAETDEASQDALRENCVVYLSSEKGLLFKYKGLENVPEKITLKNGSYTAEAWTGDSVSASFDKKFYRGYQKFDVTSGVNQVVVNCKIANVVVSVNPASIKPELMKDWNIHVENSRAGLDFTADNMDYAKGYFMMPNNDTELIYTITGTNAEGVQFEHKGAIKDPKRAHEYTLNIDYNPDYQETGGSFVTILVDDSEVLVEDEVELFARPLIQGEKFDITKQLTGNAGEFGDALMKIKAFGGITRMVLSTQDSEALPALNGATDLMNATEGVIADIKGAGITWNMTHDEERNITLCYLTLGSKLLNTLPERDQEYAVKVSVTDKYGKTTEQDLRIAVGEGAIVIDDPVTIPDIPADDQMAVLSHTATLNGTIVDASAANPGIRYRESGTTDWTFVAASEAAVARQARRRLTPAQATRAAGSAFTVKLTGLKPGTRYEYQACADGFNSESKFFTTESTFTIPNAGMEEWSKFTGNSKVWIPSDDGTQKFWDTGNHGSASIGKNITNQNTSVFHSGTSSAELKSQFVGLFSIGKFAAGNIFAGEYLRTDGTDGVLSFGRSYDGSHPTKLVLYVNYRPMTAQGKGANNSYIKEGQLDEGQIYVALSTEPVEIRTKASDQKLFNPNDACILAYGQHSFTSDFGADGQLEKLEIPLEYYAKAKTTKPLYLVIVCSASKYGDFFSGGEGSTMYVDDFTLEY